eukprot:6212695-Pleurochrysis_carterae.AAC.4
MVPKSRRSPCAISSSFRKQHVHDQCGHVCTQVQMKLNVLNAAQQRTLPYAQDISMRWATGEAQVAASASERAVGHNLLCDETDFKVENRVIPLLQAVQPPHVRKNNPESGSQTCIRVIGK